MSNKIHRQSNGLTHAARIHAAVPQPQLGCYPLMAPWQRGSVPAGSTKEDSGTPGVKPPNVTGQFPCILRFISRTSCKLFNRALNSLLSSLRALDVGNGGRSVIKDNRTVRTKRCLHLVVKDIQKGLWLQSCCLLKPSKGFTAYGTLVCIFLPLTILKNSSDMSN